MSNETEKTLTTEPVSVKKSGGFSWVGTVALLSIVVSVAILAGGYIVYQQLTTSQVALAAIVNDLQATQKQNDTNELQKDIKSALQTNQQLQDDINKLQQTVAQFAHERQDNKNTLAIAQANYYVKLANDNLQYANNIPLAVTLLKMADATLHDVDDAKFADARRALASDIAKLQSAPQVDITGIFMRLTALNEQIDKLQLPNKALSADVHAVTAAADSNQAWWQRGLQNTWQALQKIVVVRYNQNGALPLVTPEQQVYLYQNLHALLEQSTWALLHGQATIYQTSLQQLAVWIKQYFVTDTTLSPAVINELNQLQQIDIHPANPDITDSLQAFETIKQDAQ
jgi:uroporphyrin-3 C-methyltransferase